MKIFKPIILLLILTSSCFILSCEQDRIFGGSEGVNSLKEYGTLEIDFELPNFPLIQSGIRRVDLALSYTMDSMYRNEFFFRVNVSDAIQVYNINLPRGRYFYQAVITCTCGGDSCIYGGFPYGYGGMKYTFDEALIIENETTYSKPVFQ